MTDQAQPLGPYDPTEAELADARAHLARREADPMGATFAAIAGALDTIRPGGVPVELAIRRARAALAAFDERQAEES